MTVDVDWNQNPLQLETPVAKDNHVVVKRKQMH